MPDYSRQSVQSISVSARHYLQISPYFKYNSTMGFKLIFNVFNPYKYMYYWQNTNLLKMSALT